MFQFQLLLLLINKAIIAIFITLNAYILIPRLLIISLNPFLLLLHPNMFRYLIIPFSLLMHHYPNHILIVQIPITLILRFHTFLLPYLLLKMFPFLLVNMTGGHGIRRYAH